MPLALEGVWNFRDFGGLPTVHGVRIRTGQLFRSAHFGQPTGADIAKLDSLGVRLVADLRHPTEREHRPGAWPGARGPAAIFRDREPVSLAEASRPPPAVGPQPFSAAIARANMLAVYRRIPLDPATVLLMSRLLRALADQGGPIVVCCTSGKDRTGVACAVIQAALGVPYPAIEADYLRTNEAVGPERKRLVRADMEAEIGRPLGDEEIEPLLGVEPACLAAALSEIADDGGMDAYLQRRLGIGPAAREAMRARLCK